VLSYTKMLVLPGIQEQKSQPVMMAIQTNIRFGCYDGVLGSLAANEIFSFQ
jgi:hypothetical protein